MLGTLAKDISVVPTAPLSPVLNPHRPLMREIPGPRFGEEASVFAVSDGAVVLGLGRHRDDPELVELDVRTAIDRHVAVADVPQPDLVGEVVADNLTLSIVE
jgi:hypothetical protein